MARILCVDDSEELRECVAELLTAEAHEVAFARDGLEALGLAARPPVPDLIVLDLMMPTLSGWELLNELRASEALSRVPVLVTSVFTPMPGQLSPVDGYLAKPYLAKDLVQSVRRLVDQPRGL